MFFLKRWVQTAYNAIHRYQPPKSVKALITLAGTMLMRFPNISKIILRAFEISSWVETEDISGLLKKKTVTKKIQDLAEAFDLSLPQVAVNFINELCALAVHFINTGKEET